MNALDENDRLRNGSLPRDPIDDCDPCGGASNSTSGEERTNTANHAPEPWVDCVTPVSEEWFAKAPPPRQWLLRDSRTQSNDGVLPLGKVGQLVAEGGAGKTMALVQLALAVAHGEAWLGTFSAKKGRVLLALGEEDLEEVQRRMFNAARAMGVGAPPSNSIVTLPLAGVACALIERGEHGDPVDSKFFNWLRAYVVANGPFDFIIVEPLSRFAGSDAEKDNAAGTRFIQALESLAKATGATVLTAPHTNKVSRAKGATVDTSSARGSTSLTDGARWVATLGEDHHDHGDPIVNARLGAVVTLSFTKSNYSPRAAPLLLRRDRENMGALLPLAATDLAMVANAKASDATRKAKRQKSESDRDELLEAREQKEKARATKKALEKEAVEAEKRKREDAAMLACLREGPVATGKLAARLAVLLGSCSNERAPKIAERAIALGIAETFHPEGGPANAKSYRLVYVGGASENPPYPLASASVPESGKQSDENGKREAGTGKGEA